MSKCICHICGDIVEAYYSPHYPCPVSDNVLVKIYDVKTGYFNTKQWRTCRHCATAVRSYIDKLSRELKEEFE